MFIRANEFLEYLRKVYFPGGGFNTADFIIANGGLVDVFIRAMFLEEDSSRREVLQRNMETCEANLETALARIPIHIPNTIEYCLALVFGVCVLPSYWTIATPLSFFSRCLQHELTCGYLLLDRFIIASNPPSPRPPGLWLQWL